MKKRNVLKALGTVAVIAGAGAYASKGVNKKISQKKEESERDEQEARATGQIRYNVFAADRVIIVNEPDMEGFDVNATMSSLVINMANQTFLEDTYVGFSAKFSSVKIILPNNVNVSVDVAGSMSKISNAVANDTEEETVTIYIIGTAKCSSVEIMAQ